MVDIDALTPEAKKARKTRLKEKETLTARISESSRFVSFGLLALYYGLRTANDPFSARVLANSSFLITLMAAYAVVAILCDYFQYYFGVHSVQNALDSDDQQYDETRCDYQLRHIFFETKQVLVILGAGLLLIAIVQNI